MTRILLCALFATPLFAEIPLADLEANQRHTADVIAFVRQMPPDQRARYLRQRERIKRLRDRIAAREAEGGQTTCAYEILTEARWIASSAIDAARLEKRLDDLEQVLAHPELERRATEQDPTDGSYGHCHDEWFFKLNATFDRITTANTTSRLPFRLLDRINSPAKLRAYLTSLAVSDIAATGQDHRRELNESLSALIRLILRDRPAGYAWHPELKQTLLDVVLHQLRNPRTGYWGERYRRGDSTEFIDDLSITFHVISYLRGEVPDLDKVAAHLLATKDLEYPIGWRENGRNDNHHNMDVVTLLRLAWPHLDAATRERAAVEIARMLDWCLHESLQADGSFKMQGESSDSLEENNSWGVSFLARAGYFERSQRFWTTQDFPEAEAVRQRLIAYIEAHRKNGGAGGAYYESDLQELGAAPKK